jgi:tetratricopeptide (TPR) repeat protein
LTVSASIVGALAAVSIMDGQSQLQPSSVEAHLKRGNELRLKKDWDAAIAEYREVLRLDPKNADAHRVLGAALRGKGDFDGTLAEERGAVHLNPKSDFAHLQLASRSRTRATWMEQLPKNAKPCA